MRLKEKLIFVRTELQLTQSDLAKYSSFVTKYGPNGSNLTDENGNSMKWNVDVTNNKKLSYNF